MGTEAGKVLGKFASKNRYLLMLLLVGVVLILFPGGSSDNVSASATEAEQRLQGGLQSMEGVGDVYVLLAEAEGHNKGFRGAVILCEGADAANVRLNVVEAVSAFTGLGSDRIMVLKMKS